MVVALHFQHRVTDATVGPVWVGFQQIHHRVADASGGTRVAGCRQIHHRALDLAVPKQQSLLLGPHMERAVEHCHPPDPKKFVAGDPSRCGGIGPQGSRAVGSLLQPGRWVTDATGWVRILQIQHGVTDATEGQGWVGVLQIYPRVTDASGGSGGISATSSPGHRRKWGTGWRVFCYLITRSPTQLWDQVG